jgi:hypothetical protein
MLPVQRSSVSIEVGSFITAVLPAATTDMESETAIPATTDTTKDIDVATVPPASWDEVALECAKWCSRSKGEENAEKSFHDLVQNQLLPFLQSTNVVRETLAAAVQSLVSLPFLQQTAKEQSSEIECDETLIRQVQLQIALRLAFWVWGKQAFVASYQSFYQRNQRPSNPKRRGKMKRQFTLEKNGRLLQDIIGLLQLGALRLPPQRPFLEFVQQCVSKHQSEALADDLDTIWETFEVDNPFILKDRDALVPAIISPPLKKPVTTQLRCGSSAPIQQQQMVETATQSKVDRIDCILPVANVSLIAPKRHGLLPMAKNSLLLGKSKRFVGSHFNTGLTNVQALFRQVPVPVGGATTTLSSKRKNSQANTTGAKNQSNTKLFASNRNGASATSDARVPVDSIEPMELSIDAFPSPKRRRATERPVPNQLSVLDTPCRSRPGNASHCVADTLLQCPKRLEPPRAIAGLTLVKAASSMALPVSRRLSTKLPIPAKSLVADALNSLSRRQNRRMSA